jgi:hypothetical protein
MKHEERRSTGNQKHPPKANGGTYLAGMELT